MFTSSLLPAFGEVEFEAHAGIGRPLCELRVTGYPENDGNRGGRVLELRTYHAATGKLDALLARFRDHDMKLFRKHGMTCVGSWVPVDNPNNLLIHLLAYPSRKVRDESWKDFRADPDWKMASAESEAHGKLVAKVDELFLVPTDFSEGFAHLMPYKLENLTDKSESVTAAEHLFEIRTYTATPDRLPFLHSRFREHTLALFAKHGMTNLAYFQLSPGQMGEEQTLLYFVAHKDEEAATASWKNFHDDPTWIAAKKASEKSAGGSLTVEGGVVSEYLKPLDFSPVR